MSSPFQGTYPTGGIPADPKDVPASAVLLAVYLALGIYHAVCFFRFSKKTFLPQAMVMGFCFSRVVTMALRIAWTTNVTSKNLSIAASIFINAGVLLIYLVNLIFAHRYILQLFPVIPTRGRHPFNLITHIYMWSVLPLLILVVVPGVELFLTSNLTTIRIARDIIRFAQCYLTVLVCIPIISTTIAWSIYMRSSRSTKPETPREATIRAAILVGVGALLVWLQAVKLCQTFYTPSPETAVHPPWFLQRPILYAGFFLPELLCVIVYAVSTIRVRFLKPVNEDGKRVAKTIKGGESDGDSNTVVDNGDKFKEETV